MPKCPTCKRSIPANAAEQTLPFCNQRCKLADLDSWLSGRYVVSDALPWGEGDEDLIVPPTDGRDGRDE